MDLVLWIKYYMLDVTNVFLFVCLFVKGENQLFWRFFNLILFI